MQSPLCEYFLLQTPLQDSAYQIPQFITFMQKTDLDVTSKIHFD